ncbi:MAG: hypothetical protein RR619_10940, partial [Raoultibacter sp.]
MKDVLDRNGVEYTISHETAPDAVFSLDSRTYSEGTDITLFELPNRNIGPKASIHAPFSQTDHTLAKPDHPFTQLRDLDPEVLSLFSYFDRQSMIEKWALRGAIDELTRGDLLQEALGLGKPQHFQVGAKQNFIAEFTTVKWDPQARIIAEPLERMGVPFELNIVDDVAYFEIAEQNAAAFKAVADFHLSNETSRIRPTRFPNYDALEIVTKTPGSKTELIEVTVADQGAATLIKDEFSERGIPYESLTSRTTGESTFLVSKQELVNKAPELAVAQKEFAAAARKPKQTAATRIRQQEAERIFGNTINKPPSLIDESKVSANRKPTPARDQRIAKQSAQARYRAQTKKLSRSAVRTPRAEGNLK